MPVSFHAPTRRELLVGSGVLFAWAAVPHLARAEGRDPRLLTIVLRGALDGLAVVAPVGDPDWTKLRSEKSLTADGQTPALPLDGFFALNPAMPNFHRLYQARQATIVHAVATPYRERSHFDGQDVLESGLAKPGAADTGWLNRALGALEPGGHVDPHARQAFAVGPITPLVVRGPAPVLSWVPPRLPPVSDETTMRLLDLYRHTDPTFARVHPTPLYELAAGLLIGWWLWRRGAKPRPTGEILGEYLMLAGIARFLVEFIRRNPKILWGLSNAQIAAAASAIAGAVLIWWASTRRVPGPEKAAASTAVEKAA